jgi:hypothetical protein
MVTSLIWSAFVLLLVGMVRPLELDNQAEIFFRGLKTNASVRIEFLTISIRKGSGINLKEAFETLCIRIAGRKRKSLISWAGVWVDDPPEHAHILWRKPYVRYNRLNAMWFDITKGQGTGIVSKTVKGDKSKRNEVRRLVYYMIEQGHHYSLDTECSLPFTFSHSHNWFKKLKLTKKQEKSQSEKQDSLDEVLSYD